MASAVPRQRVTSSDAPIRPDGAHVLYWMTGARRVRFNFGLQHALFHAEQLGKPLLVFEALAADYPWASRRFHRFVVEGMRDNARALQACGTAYYPYVEPSANAGQGLLEALAADACLVVTDESPIAFVSKMVATARGRLDCRLEAVDGNGLLPLREGSRAWSRAHHFRRHLQRTLPPWLASFPEADPVGQARVQGGVGRAQVSDRIAERWPAADLVDLDALVASVEGLPAPDSVVAVGGAMAGQARLDQFLERRILRYEERNQPSADSASGLSPYLHFGHVGAHQVVQQLFEVEDWDPGRLADKTDGSRQWYGLSEAAESFMDELVTWRELGQGDAFYRPRDHCHYEGLPQWARKSLEQHAEDERPHLYDMDTLAGAQTDDDIWNAAQTQLVREGEMHNYLRMLWGKRVLEWTEHPRQAFDVLVELNNRYAIDGRDPNSYTGIAWVMGGFDRAWGPERDIFGKIRYMSSANTRRKLRLGPYLEEFE